MRYLITILLGTLCLINTGCLQTTKLTSESTQQWGEIAVVSRAASKLNFDFVGTTVFNNRAFSKELESETLDEKLTNHVAKSMSLKGLNAVSKPKLRPMLLKQEDEGYPRTNLDLTEIKQQLAHVGTYTHLAVVANGIKTPMAYIGDPIGGSNIPLEGIALYKRSILGMSSGAHFYTCALIRIYDLQTEEVVSYGSAFDFRKISLSAFPESADEVKTDKATLFIQNNFDLVMDTYDLAVDNLFE